MRKQIWEALSRLIRHGLAPLVALLVGEDLITEDQGVNLVNAVLVIGSTVFVIVWSWARAQFPWIRWL